MSNRWRSWLWHCATNRKVAGSIQPIPVAERSKAWVCSLSPAGIAGSKPAGGMDVCVVCVAQQGQRGQKAQPGQSGQRRSTDEVQRKKIPDGVTGIFQ